MASSKWATPIVSVFKGDGSICISGDYKQSANKEANCNKYPNQRHFCYIEWEEGRGGGGGEFIKLDLSQAWQQLLLSLNSRELLTINTHKGLFQPTRLQFGVH